MTKKTVDNFFKNYKIVGRPKNIIKSVEKGTTIRNAFKFLNSRLKNGQNGSAQITPYGSEWPNKHPWAQIVASLNNYNLRNAQKNMIKRVYIATASQPVKSGSEVRKPVRVRLEGKTLEQAIENQKKAIQAEINNSKRQANERRQESKTAPAAAPSPPWKPVATYGVY